MEFKCDYCNGNYDDTLENCPHCGAQNNHIRRVADATPKTIAELKQWYIDRKLPPSEVTRFFIGENYTKPRAFGIYEENGKYIVYKNKDTGERAIRYEGTDEAYAVNELYLKLKSEILNQKSLQRSNSGNTGKKNKKAAKETFIGGLAIFGGIIVLGLLAIVNGLLPAIGIGAGVTVAMFVLLVCIKNGAGLKKVKWPVYLAVFIATTVISFIPLHKYNTPHYYMYNDTVYCNYRGDYYYYDSYDYYPIEYSSLPTDFTDHTVDYEYTWSDDSWNDNYDFSSSDYYTDYLSSSGSSDSDSDWDWGGSDSWDSGGSDWSSDWLQPTIDPKFIRR